MLGTENNKTKFSTIWEDMDEGFDEYQQASGQNDFILFQSLPSKQRTGNC